MCDLLEGRLVLLEILFQSLQNQTIVLVSDDLTAKISELELKNVEKKCDMVEDKDKEVKGWRNVRDENEEKQEKNERVVGEETAPLCHGLMLALRYCLKELHTAGLLTSTTTTTISALTPINCLNHKNESQNPTEKRREEGSNQMNNIDVILSIWQPLIKRVLALSLHALSVSKSTFFILLVL